MITSVTVRVRRLAAVKTYDGWRWPSFAEGAAAMRTLAQAGLLPTVIRLSDESETAINLARPEEIGGDAEAGCLMIVGYEGTAEQVAAKHDAVTAVLAGLGGTDLGEEPGRAWAHGRFNAPYLRDSLLDVGVLVETLETATFWSNLDRLYAEVKGALEGVARRCDGALPHQPRLRDRGLALLHRGRARPATTRSRSGRSPRPPPPTRWSRPAPRSPTTTRSAPTTSRGSPARSGRSASRSLRAVKDSLDPTGVLNPGVLIP